MKHFVLKHPNGETIVATSLEGHEDCDLVGEASRAPDDCETWDPKAKRWKVDTVERDKRDRAMKGRDLGAMLDRIDALEAKVDALEAALKSR